MDTHEFFKEMLIHTFREQVLNTTEILMCW
uniref:Uncharacterized protein n=1 Tax=Arundo donax TaxID=35708 RepID=A0A0A8ZFY3_ARUDO